MANDEASWSQLDSAAAEGSVPYDPQTNGAVESAVKVVKQSLRANLLTLERRLRARIPPTHVVVAWLVRHSRDSTLPNQLPEFVPYVAWIFLFKPISKYLHFYRLQLSRD